MSTPKRIQRKRTKGWWMPEDAMYVGRPSRWGNPFRIYHEHHLIGPSWTIARTAWRHIPSTECINAYISSSEPMGPADAVEAFANLMHVRARDEQARLRDWLAPLVGHDLACWCPLDQPCHADVLLELANDLVTVCSECRTTACWDGNLMCEDAQSAGTVQIPAWQAS